MTDTAPSAALEARFSDHLETLEVPAEGDGVVVALSGGLDSMVLLHLLRFTAATERLRLHAAHLDHALRDRSAGDAAWVAGVARSWGIPLSTHRLGQPPANEEAARDRRYAWLEAVREEHGARWVATAHHADDQAETVLFRIARGTGIPGLVGIRSVDPERALLRPLLPFWRSELTDYARRRRLAWRRDRTNLDRRFARNVIRHDVLPTLEAEVAPGVRESLVRLAGLASENEAAWAELMEGLLDAVVEESTEGRIVVGRQALVSLGEAVRARVLREVVRRVGGALDEAGTRLAMEFSSSGASGKGVDLPSSVRVERAFGRMIFVHGDRAGTSGSRGGAGDAPDECGASVLVTAGDAGSAELRSGARSYAVRWWSDRGQGGQGEGDIEESGLWVARLDPEQLDFPLRVRPFREGDRMRLGYGSKKLVKLMAEARVPFHERHGRPVLADASDDVVWLPGIAVDPGVRGGPANADVLTISISDADDIPG